MASVRPMRSFLLLLVGASLGLGCEVLIGDSCLSDSECSQQESRLCLTERFDRFPGGYCAAFNCAPGTCSSEAVCIGYQASTGGPGCLSSYESADTLRSFCMRSCKTDADCRGGYSCIDPTSAKQPWGAVLLEADGSSPKICAVPYEGPELQGSAAICSTPGGDDSTRAEPDAG